MDATFQAQNLESQILSNIFSGMDVPILKNATVDADIDLKSKNNDMTVTCQVRINQLALNIQKDSDSLSFEDMLLQGLEKFGQGVELQFRFKTKMDEWKVNSLSFSGMVHQGERGSSSSEE